MNRGQTDAASWGRPDGEGDDRPIEFVVTESDESVDALAVRRGADRGTVAPGREGTAPGAIGRSPRRARRSLIAAAAGFLVLLFGAAQVINSLDGADVEVMSADSIPDATDVDNDIDVGESAGGVDDPGEATSADTLPPVDQPDSTDEPDSTGDNPVPPDITDLFADEADERIDAVVAGWRSSRIDVPGPLAQLSEPTTVVTFGSDFVLREIDLPAGEVRSIDLADHLDVGVGSRYSIVVGRDSTLLVDDGIGSDGHGLLVSAAQPPIRVPDAVGLFSVRPVPGSGAFSALSIGATGAFTRVGIDADGRVVIGAVVPADELPWRERWAPDGGGTIVPDSGGVFERAPSGTTTRLSDGEVVAVSSHHVLVRECDATRRCVGVRLDGRTGARTEVSLTSTLVPSLTADTASVSPDGRYLRFVDYTLAPVEWVIDLDDGSTPVRNSRLDDFSALQLAEAEHVWPADSSGVFGLFDGRLRYRAISTSNVTWLDLGLGSDELVDFSVRLDLGGVPTPPLISSLEPGVRVVAFGTSGEVYEIDFDAASVTATGAGGPEMPRLVHVLVDDDGATALLPGADQNLRFDRADRTVTRTTSAADGPIIAATESTAWRPESGDRDGDGDGDADATPGAFMLIDSLGNDLDTRLNVPADSFVAGSDGAGGLLVVAADGTISSMSATTGDAEPLLATDGSAAVELLALSDTHTLTRACTDEGCVTRLAQRGSDDVTVVDVPPTVVPQPALTDGGDTLITSTLSPDGTVAFVDTTALGDWAFVDLTSGTVTPVRLPQSGSQVVWSADNRYAILHTRSRNLVLFDRDAANVREFPNLPRVVAMAEVDWSD